MMRPILVAVDRSLESWTKANTLDDTSHVDVGADVGGSGGNESIFGRRSRKQAARFQADVGP